MSLKEILKQDILRHHQLLGKEAPLGILFWVGLFSPRFIPVFIFRLSFYMQKHHLPLPARMFSMLNVTLFGIEIATSCDIGSGLFFPHTQGTVIGAVSVGKNAVIYQGVTLGAKDLDFSYDETRRPVVGDDVLIGAGAKILGGVRIGNNVRVGANSVVLGSVPDNCVAVGIPAKIIAAKEDE